jgi:hypothetical protein
MLGLGRGALVYNTGGGNNPSFSDEVYDTDNIHESVTNPERLTVPGGVTKVRLAGQILFVNTTNSVSLSLLKNGATFAGSPTDLRGGVTAPYGAIIPIDSPVLTVVEGDYFTVVAGGSLAQAEATGAYSWFAMEIIE